MAVALSVLSLAIAAASAIVAVLAARYARDVRNVEADRRHDERAPKLEATFTDEGQSSAEPVVRLYNGGPTDYAHLTVEHVQPSPGEVQRFIGLVEIVNPATGDRRVTRELELIDVEQGRSRLIPLATGAGQDQPVTIRLRCTCRTFDDAWTVLVTCEAPPWSMYDVAESVF